MQVETSVHVCSYLLSSSSLPTADILWTQSLTKSMLDSLIFTCCVLILDKNKVRQIFSLSLF